MVPKKRRNPLIRIYDEYGPRILFLQRRSSIGSDTSSSTVRSNRSSRISIESEDPYEQYNYSREEMKLKFNKFYRTQIRRLKNKYTLALVLLAVVSSILIITIPVVMAGNRSAENSTSTTTRVRNNHYF